MRLKTLLLGTLLTLVGVSFAQPVTVTWWDFLAGGDGVRMKSMIDEFNASHPDIQIDATTSEWGTPFYTKVRTSAAVGEGPDIMTYHLSRFPLAMESDLLRPFSEEELASVGLSPDDYPESLVEAATFDGQMYGIPLDIHALILYFNRDILREAGLLGEDGMPQGIEGIDNFNAALDEIQELGYTPLSFGNGDDPASVWRIFYTLLNQQGGQVLDGDEVVVGEEAQIALQTIVDWVENGHARQNVSYEAGVALFASGEAAFHMNGVWEVPTMVDLAEEGELFDWGAMAIPVLFDQPATWADSHSFAIPNSPSNPISDEKLAAVLEVIAWMNQNSMTWATAGHIPAYNEVVASDEYQAMEPNATYAVLAENAVYDPRSRIAGVAGPIYDAMNNYFAPAVNGQLPTERALDMFTQELESELR